MFELKLDDRATRCQAYLLPGDDRRRRGVLRSEILVSVAEGYRSPGAFLSSFITCGVHDSVTNVTRDPLVKLLVASVLEVRNPGECFGKPFQDEVDGGPAGLAKMATDTARKNAYESVGATRQLVQRVPVARTRLFDEWLEELSDGGDPQSRTTALELEICARDYSMSDKQYWSRPRLHDLQGKPV